MEKHILNEAESRTVMEIVQDAMERGMISSDYELNKMRKILEDTECEWSDSGFKESVRFEVTVKVIQE